MDGLGHRIGAGVREMFRRLRQGPSPEQMVLLSPEAGFKAAQEEPGRVTLTSLLDGGVLFSVAGTLEAALTRVDADQETALRLPVQSGGERRWIRVRVGRVTPPGEWPPLRRVRAVAIPEGFEFQFRSDDTTEAAEVTLEFLLEPALEASGFSPCEDLRPLFKDLPPVAEMAAYLRACMHHRRSQVQILADLGENLRSTRILDAVGLVRQRRSAVLMTSPRLVGLAGRMAARGHDMSPSVLGAACLAAELEGRSLDLEQLREVLEDALPYEPAPSVLGGLEAVLLACFEGRLADDPEASPAERALVRVCHALTQDSPLRILSDLAAQSRGGAAGTLVRLLRRGLKDPSRLADPSQAALRRLLAGRGRPMAEGTMAGLCLFVEAELGLLGWDHLEGILRGEDRPPTSAYALAAVAGACDLELRGFRLLLQHGLGLARLSRGLALVRQERHFTTPGPLPAGPEATLVLAHLPVLENLHPPDLEVLRQANPRVRACYRSPEGGRTFWSDGPVGDYAFAGRALGRLVAAPAADLAGRTGVVSAWADARGQLHYRYHDVVHPGELRPSEGDLRWTGEIAELPEPRGLPATVRELNRHELADLDDPSRLPAGLVQLREALNELHGDRDSPGSLHLHPRLLELVRRGLVSPGVLERLGEVARQRTREALAEASRRPDGEREELVAHPSLLFMLEVAETVDTGLLAAAASLAPGEAARDLRAALAAPLREHAHSAQTAVRWAISRVLGTRLGQEMAEVAVEILAGLRHDGSRGVAGAATASLVSLALSPTRPAPPLLEIRPVRRQVLARRADEAARLAALVTDHVRGYVLFPTEDGEVNRLLVREEASRAQPDRARIEGLCRLVAGLNMALLADPRPSRLEVRPLLPGEAPQTFPLESGAPCGPWLGSEEVAAMADRTRYSPFFERLCRVAAQASLEDLEILRYVGQAEASVYDRAAVAFRAGEVVRPALAAPREELRIAARRLIQRLALAPALEEHVVSLLDRQWDRIRQEALL